MGSKGLEVFYGSRNCFPEQPNNNSSFFLLANADVKIYLVCDQCIGISANNKRHKKSVHVVDGGKKEKNHFESQTLIVKLASLSKTRVMVQKWMRRSHIRCHVHISGMNKPSVLSIEDCFIWPACCNATLTVFKCPAKLNILEIFCRDLRVRVWK